MSRPPRTPTPTSAGPLEIPGVPAEADLPPLAEPAPAPPIADPPRAIVVTGVRVRARRRHEHDGTVHPAGAEFAMCPDAARLSAARGDIDLLHFIEEEVKSEHDTQ